MSFALRRGRRGGGAAAGGGGHQRDDQPGICSRESEDSGGCHLPSTLHVVTSPHPPLQNSAVSFSRIGNIRQSGQLNTCVTCPPPSPLCPGTLAPSVTLQLGGIFTRLRMFGLAPPSHSPIRLLSKQRGNAESYQSCGNCLETEFVANESRIPVGLVDDNQTRGMQCMCSMAGGM